MGKQKPKAFGIKTKGVPISAPTLSLPGIKGKKAKKTSNPAHVGKVKLGF